MDIKIGIIGQGFVGGTLYKALSQLSGYEVRAYDKLPDRTKNTLDEVAECDIVFVAVPTPMVQKTGECFTGFVDRAVADLRQRNKDNLIVIKSTVPPGTTERLNFNYKKIAFKPEFLTEANAYEDFVNLPYQILGYGDPSQLEDKDFLNLQNLFFKGYTQGILASEKVYSISARVAEMTKYTRNCYLATRLSFFNEIKQICDKLEIPYDELKYFVGLEPRIGQHYNRVEEGNEGWGKSCLPKDINALRFVAKKHKVDPKVLTAAWDKNLEVIPEHRKDWEQMSGRAVVKTEDNDR